MAKAEALIVEDGERIRCEMSELEKLKAQNVELSDRIAKLEEAAKPPKPVEWVHQPPDYTAGMTAQRMFSRETLERLAAADDPRGRAADLRKPNPITASQSPITSTPSALPQRRNTGGWREEAPLGPQPGIEHVDRLVDAQDRIDRVELAQKLAKAELAKRSSSQ